MTVAHTPGIGDVLGGCRLDRLAARGGMGVVYEAMQLALGRRVAVKVISPQLADDPEFRDRFVREAQLAASVHHTNIVDVYDAGEQDGVLYLVMRFVDGTDLRTILRAEPRLAPERAVRIASQVAGALDAAHRAGLIHRDVTPSNVLLSSAATGEQASLTDFGLVKHVDSAGETRTGTWFGTLAFVSPEALRDAPVDGRADVYALGCVLHRMIAGQVPYPRESDAAMIAAHLHDPPPRPSLMADVPAAMDDVIARALAKRPEDRFTSAGELAAAARAALGDRTAADDERTSATRVVPVTPAAAREPRRPADRTRIAPPRAEREPARRDSPKTAKPAPGSRRWRVPLAALLAVAVGAAGALAIRSAVTDGPATPPRPRAIPKTPVTPHLTAYSTSAYSAGVPVSWRRLADDVDRGDFNESRWRAPYPRHGVLVITYRKGSPASPEGIANAARARAATDRTFSELALGPIAMNGFEAYRWVYGIDGQARVTWYMNPCGTSIAISGSTRPSEVLRWAPTFRAVAASLRPSCG